MGDPTSAGSAHHFVRRGSGLLCWFFRAYWPRFVSPIWHLWLFLVLISVSLIAPFGNFWPDVDQNVLFLYFFENILLFFAFFFRGQPAYENWKLLKGCPHVVFLQRMDLSAIMLALCPRIQGRSIRKGKRFSLCLECFSPLQLEYSLELTCLEICRILQETFLLEQCHQLASGSYAFFKGARRCSIFILKLTRTEKSSDSSIPFRKKRTANLWAPLENRPAHPLFQLVLLLHIFSTCLYLAFAVVLGATCTREVLQTDYMIAEKVRTVIKFNAHCHEHASWSVLGVADVAKETN